LSELAERRAVSLPTISNSIHILEKRGWVRRVRSDEDRRKVAVEITDEGREILNHVQQHTVKKVAEVIAAITEHDQEIISEGLLILRDAFIQAAHWDEYCPTPPSTHNDHEQGES
jgi:DNA-binding MarR family transcriptional regulator